VASEESERLFGRAVLQNEQSSVQIFAAWSGVVSATKWYDTGLSRFFEFGGGYEGWLDWQGFRVKVRYERHGEDTIKHSLVADRDEPSPDDNHVHFMEYFRTTDRPAPYPKGYYMAERYNAVADDMVVARVKVNGGLSGDDRHGEINRGMLLRRIEDVMRSPSTD
jgi:hypothetical protein